MPEMNTLVEHIYWAALIYGWPIDELLEALMEDKC